MSLVLYLKNVKDAFDNECFDVEPETMEYAGTPWVFAPGQQLEVMLPTITPDGVENLTFDCEPELPAGMTLDDETGAISGCPTNEGCCPATDFTVTCENSAGFIECVVNIMVQEVPPTSITFEAESAVFTVGADGTSVAPTVAPADTKVTLKIEPELHPGLTFDPETGLISGTAESYDEILEPKSTKHTVSAWNSGGEVSTEISVQVVHAPPTSLLCETLSLTVGEEFSTKPMVAPEGCLGVFSAFSETSANPLPEGITLDPATGVISGTPVAPVEKATTTLKLANSGGEQTCKVDIIIVDAPPTSISYEGAIKAIAEVGIEEGGGAPTVEPATPVTFSIEPALPSGLSFDSATGSVTGVPDSSAVGESTHTVTATNTGGSVSTELAVAVLEVPPSGLEYPNGNKLNILMASQVEFEPTFEGKGTFTCESLPEGLSLAEDGKIVGVVGNMDLYNTESTSTVVLSNSGGQCTAEVTFSFSDPKRQFLEYVDEHQDDYVKVLADYVKLETKTGSNESSALGLVKDQATKLQSSSDTPIEVVSLDDGLIGVCFRAPETDAATKTLCVYGHLDTEEGGDYILTKAGGDLFGCGTSDAKGPIVAWMCTADAYVKLGKAFPVNLKLVIDTTGCACSSALASGSKVKEFVSDVDSICISDGSWLTAQKPCVTYALRGVMHFTVKVSAGSQNLNSGSFGGTVHEAMTEAAALMSALTTGSLTAELQVETDPAEVANAEKVAFDIDTYCKQLGIAKAAADNQSALLKSRWLDPSLSLLSVESSTTPGPVSHVCAYMMPNCVTFTFGVRTPHGSDHGAVEASVKKCLEEAFAGLGSANTLDVVCDQQGAFEPLVIMTHVGVLQCHLSWPTGQRPSMRQLVQPLRKFMVRGRTRSGKVHLYLETLCL